MKVFGMLVPDLVAAPVPVGKKCLWCEEVFVENDVGYTLPYSSANPQETEDHFHRACQLRQIVGSVGHLLHRCHCFGGTDEDPRGMTKRQAAVAVMELLELREQMGALGWVSGGAA